MKQAQTDRKPTQRRASVATSRERTERMRGESISPPAYGMDTLDRGVLQRQTAPTAAETGATARRPNHTGLPDRLKNGVEVMSGYSLDNVRVHYNSPKPAQLNALAYTQGAQIHVAPGQERHLPHEAWHVVQQAQGRVRPTMQMKGVGVNDDAGLEREAEVMGTKAAFATNQMQADPQRRTAAPVSTIVQRQHFRESARDTMRSSWDAVKRGVHLGSHGKTGTPANETAQHQGDEVWRKRKIVWNAIRAAGHFVGGTVAILAGAGVTPTIAGTPAGMIGIIYGVVKDIKGIVVAIPDAIHIYARRWGQKFLSGGQQLVIEICDCAKTALDTIGAIVSINFRKAASIVLTAVSQLLKGVAGLADKGGQYHGFPEIVQRVLAWISSGAKHLSEAISHINAFLNTEKEDEILAAVYGVVKTIFEWFQSIYEAYKLVFR